MARALAAADADSSGRAAHARKKRKRLRAIALVHERAVQEALSEGATLIHGEFYPSNVLVDQRGTSCSIHPLDWEMAGAGSPLLDLAALLSGRWARDDRENMQQAYCDGATEGRACFATPDAFRRRLTACRSARAFGRPARCAG